MKRVFEDHNHLGDVQRIESLNCSLMYTEDVYAGLSHIGHYASVSILFIFEIELLIVMFGMGPRFFRSPMLVLDWLVVTVSLVFDLLFVVFVDVVVVLRIWRVIRIIHGASESVVEHKNHEIVWYGV